MSSTRCLCDSFVTQTRIQALPSTQQSFNSHHVSWHIIDAEALGLAVQRVGLKVDWLYWEGFGTRGSDPKKSNESTKWKGIKPFNKNSFRARPHLASSAFKETNRPPSVGMICRFFTFSTSCGFFVAATATISSKSCKTSISSQTHPSNMNTKRGKKSSTTSYSKKTREREREKTP